LKGIGFDQTMLSYYYALSIDISATAFLMGLPTLLLIIAVCIKKNSVLINSIHTINIILIIFCLIIGIFDTGLYSVWGTKINGKAISYMAFPKEAIKSFAAVPYILFIAILVIEGVLSIFIYKRIFRPGFFGKINIYFKIIYPIVLMFVLFSAVRGNFNKYPINKSRVYYSKFPILNYSALNGFWNFMEILVNPDIKKNTYNYFSKETAKSIVKNMRKTSADTTEIISTTSIPNIILILLESINAECKESFGGKMTLEQTIVYD
jgi:hypothetical protein